MYYSIHKQCPLFALISAYNTSYHKNNSFISFNNVLLDPELSSIDYMLSNNTILIVR